MFTSIASENAKMVRVQFEGRTLKLRKGLSIAAALLEAGIIHISDIICRALNLGSGGDQKIPPLNKAAWNALRIKPAAIESIMADLMREFDDISSFAA